MKKPSLTTPGHKMTLRNSLAELVLLRANHGKLPEYFWRDTRWKWAYAREVQAITKFIKKYGEDVVSKVILSNYVATTADYGNLEFLLQEQMDKLARLYKPKDTTPVKAEVDEKVPDLREPRPSSFKRKSIWERLDEIEREV
jgi:hypothetical protein